MQRKTFKILAALRLCVKFARFSAVVIFACALLAACTPTPEPPTATPAPTITVYSLVVPHEMDILLPTISSCEAQVAGAGLLVYDPDEAAAQGITADITLYFGEHPPAGASAALLGMETFYVITGAGNERSIPDQAALIEIFTGESGSGQPEIWVPLPGMASRDLLDGIMGSAAYSPAAFIAPNAEAALSAAVENADALSVVPAAWLTDEVRTVFSLGEAPVLALTDGPPEGLMRALLGCLQLNPVYK